MEFFRFRKDIPFMQRALIFNAISLLTLEKERVWQSKNKGAKKVEEEREE